MRRLMIYRKLLHRNLSLRWGWSEWQAQTATCHLEPLVQQGVVEVVVAEMVMGRMAEVAVAQVVVAEATVMAPVAVLVVAMMEVAAKVAARAREAHCFRW